MKDKSNNVWNIIGLILLIILFIIIMNKFSGTIEKSDILNFYSNLLVVIITVALGIITYEQTKHIQEESSKENEYLREINKEANETNKEILNIIKRNTQLEEQRNMPCLNVKFSVGSIIHSEENNEIELELENIGNTIIKYIDIDEVPEEVIIQSMNDIIIDSVKNVLGYLTKSFGTFFNEHTKKTDFLEFFNHNIDMVGIDEKFSINIKPKKIKEQVKEELYVIALNMKIENIYGKRYKEKVIILLEKNRNKDQQITYTVEGKYIDIDVID